jgi:hypothetical protein
LKLDFWRDLLAPFSSQFHNKTLFFWFFLAIEATAFYRGAAEDADWPACSFLGPKARCKRVAASNSQARKSVHFYFGRIRPFSRRYAQQALDDSDLLLPLRFPHSHPPVIPGEQTYIIFVSVTHMKRFRQNAVMNGKTLRVTEMRFDGLPARRGPRPKTIRGPLHIQCNGHGDPRYLHQLVDEVLTWPHIESAVPSASRPTTIPIRVMKIAIYNDPSAFISSREFARVLLGAPTIYLALPLVCAHWAIVRGWAEPHYLARPRLRPTRCIG